MVPEELQLLQHEPESINADATEEPQWETVLIENAKQAPEADLRYWRAFQAFAKDRRTLLSRSHSNTPDMIEKQIKLEWKSVQLAKAKSAKLARSHEQQFADVQNALDSAKKRKRSEQPSTSTKRAKVTDEEEPPPQPSKYVPGKFADTDISQIECKCCGDKNGTPSNQLIICDGCNKGFHQSCFKISAKPQPNHDWLCNDCIEPGLRVAILDKRTKKWLTGVVRAQHPNGQGTEIAYTNGRRSNENMYAVSWHPVYTQDLASIIANLETSFETSGQNLSVWLATTPRSLAHLRKFPQAVQHKWYLSRIKEFESIIAKGAAEIIDRSQIPLNALLIPTAWGFRIKLDGTLKSRLVLLGHLMPKDEDFDISAPTPRLSSVRFILAIAIKMDLAASLDDVDTAFTYAVPHTTLLRHVTRRALRR